MIKGENQTHTHTHIYIYIHIVFVTFFLIFKFILIYLLHVLFVLKNEGIFGKRKSQLKKVEMVIFFIYSKITSVETSVFFFIALMRINYEQYFLCNFDFD